MLVRCLHSYSDPDTLEQLWLCAEWVSTMPLGLRFYIREDRVNFALLIDPHLEPCSEQDYIL
jgi:hypothetical protein